ARVGRRVGAVLGVPLLRIGVTAFEDEGDEGDEGDHGAGGDDEVLALVLPSPAPARADVLVHGGGLLRRRTEGVTGAHGCFAHWAAAIFAVLIRSPSGLRRPG